MKTCNECRVTKDDSEFYQRHDTGKVAGRCKVCYRARQNPVSLARYYDLKAAGVCPHCKADALPGRVHCASYTRDDKAARLARQAAKEARP